MFFRFNLFAILWAGLIFVLSLLPGDDMPSVTFWELLAFDKVAHIFVYAVFVLLLIVGFLKQYSFIKLRYHAVKVAIIVAVAYGGMLELFQGFFMAERYADIMDFLANFIGSLSGVGLYYAIYFKLD